jgi:amidohydrolase
MIMDEVRDLNGDLVALRRSLHREPEVGLHLPRTQAITLDALSGIDLELTLGRATSSIVGVLRGGRPGATVLLRADMDALPLQEEYETEFTSTNPQAMHACGHDLHTTMLVGAARLLDLHRDQLPGNVILMFQPGEEGHDGARYMLEEGVLDAAGERPVASYALHVFASMIKAGVFTTRPGSILASAEKFELTVTGQGGGGSNPWNARDPIPAACEILLAVQSHVARRFSVFDPVVFSPAGISGGSTFNVIPNQVVVRGTIRTFSQQASAKLKAAVDSISTSVAAGQGLAATVAWSHAYPPVINDEAETEVIATTASDLFGRDRFAILPTPLTSADDYARVLAEIPGCYVFVGACVEPGTESTAVANHNSRARHNETVIADGAALLAETTMRRLALAGSR